MTLEEIDEMAKELTFYSSQFGLVNEIVNDRWPVERLTDFARATSAMLPVIRAAMAHAAKVDVPGSCGCALCTSVEAMQESVR